MERTPAERRIEALEGVVHNLLHRLNVREAQLDKRIAGLEMQAGTTVPNRIAEGLSAGAIIKVGNVRWVNRGHGVWDKVDEVAS